MIVAYDNNGYSYRTDTGAYVTLYYDENGAAYDSATDELVDEVIVDAGGSTVYTGGGGIDWNNVINQAAQAYAAGQGATQTGYYPRQTTSPTGGYQTYSGGAGLNVSGGLNPGGAKGSLNISTNTLILIAAGVLLFMMGTKKGR